MQNWHITTRHPPLADLPRALAAIAAADELFDPATPLTLGRAPGRLDVMGGIADYSGSLVLEMPIAAAAYAAVQLADDDQIIIRTTDAQTSVRELRLPRAALLPADGSLSYTDAQLLLAADPALAWAAYVAGVLIVLDREEQLRPKTGVRILIDSAVPPGKGVSSSAAVEVATMVALLGALRATLTGEYPLAVRCQQVENLVVGAPCGIMDQMTSAYGRAGELLAILCQPALVLGSIALPESLRVVGIDSGVRHAVTGASYSGVRTAAFMGLRVLEEYTTVPGSYLANVPPSRWEHQLRQHIPELIDGGAFLARYGGTRDPITRVDAGQRYALRAATAHPIYEHHRVRSFAALLVLADGVGVAAEEARRLLGELMYQSHASYSACGLGTDATDALVQAARAIGADGGVYGAKITGGGSGGTVALLVRAGDTDRATEVLRSVETSANSDTRLISGSSPGAAEIGALTVIAAEKIGL